MEKINTLLKSGHISDECGIKFYTEYKILEAFIKENKSMQNIASCKSCGGNKINYKHVDLGQGKCDNCGRFTNKINASNFFSSLPVENFSLKH